MVSLCLARLHETGLLRFNWLHTKPYSYYTLHITYNWLYIPCQMQTTTQHTQTHITIHGDCKTEQFRRTKLLANIENGLNSKKSCTTLSACINSPIKNKQLNVYLHLVSRATKLGRLFRRETVHSQYIKYIKTAVEDEWLNNTTHGVVNQRLLCHSAKATSALINASLHHSTTVALCLVRPRTKLIRLSTEC